MFCIGPVELWGMPVATEFDDSEHYGLFLTNNNKADSTTLKFVRMSALTLAALRAAGLLDNMIDGTVPPATSNLWLDKNFDPPQLKEYDSISATWQVMSFERMFNRSVVIPVTVSGGTANVPIIAEPSPFMSGKVYSITPLLANTSGGVTISVTGVGTFAAVYPSGAALAANEFSPGGPSLFIFQHGRFELLFGYSAAVRAEAAADAAEIAIAGAVRFDQSQALSDPQKEQAQTNLGLINVIQSSQFAWPLDKFGPPAVGNDYSPLFAAAINNGETFIIPPKEVGISEPIVLTEFIDGFGAHFWRSGIKLLDGSNCNIFETEGAAGYFANPPSSGNPAVVPHKIMLRNFQVYGNRANNTSGHLFYLFCRHHFIEHIMAWNIPDTGLKIKYNDNGAGPITPGGSGMLGMESIVRNVYMDYIGGPGAELEGVHDSSYENIMIVHPSQKAHNTYDGVRLLNGFTGRCRNFHVYNSGNGLNHRYGLYDETGSEVKDSHFEGASTANAVIAGQRGDYSFRLYATRDPSSRNLIVLGNENIIKVRLDAKASSGDPDCVGLTLGMSSSDFPSNNIIEIQAIEQNAASIDWTHSKGGNHITMRGEQSTGPKQLGTKQPSDKIDAIISDFKFGGANNVSAAGTTQAGATLLTEKNNRVTAVAAGAGVMLPVSSSFIGEFIVVSNITSTPLLVYVNTSDSSFDYGPSQFPVSITLPAGRTSAFTATTSGVVSPLISDANWASIGFTPTVAPSSGSITAYTVNLAKYSRVGKLIHVFYDVAITTNGTGAGGVVLGLPFAVASGAGCILAGRETGSTGKQLQAYGGASATTVTVTAYDNTYPAGSGYRLILSGIYEAA